MIGEPIVNKTQMYRLLRSGQLGNYLPSWHNLEEWDKDSEANHIRLWGIRAMDSWNFNARLDVPRDEVPRYVRQHFGGKAHLVPMVDQWTVFRCQIVEASWHPCGLRVYGTDVSAQRIKWKEAIDQHSKEYTGLMARAMLERHLIARDIEQVRTLLDIYQGHVIQMTACNREVGKIPGSRIIIWAVRAY